MTIKHFNLEKELKRCVILKEYGFKYRWKSLIQTCISFVERIDSMNNKGLLRKYLIKLEMYNESIKV
jgi:hypothetical protein